MTTAWWVSIVWQLFGPIIMAFVAAIVGLAARKIDTYFDLRAESELRDALHKSLQNGVNLAVSNGITNPEAIVSTAIDYAKRLNPGTVKKMKVGDDGLSKIARSKLPARKP